MAASSASPPIALEIGRIRESSKAGRHYEALAAAEALAVAAPQNRDVLYLIAANQRCLNRIPAALATLQSLEQHHPRFSLLYQERGHCYTALRDEAHAVQAFLRAVQLNPALVPSWSMLERLYRLRGEVENTARAAEQIANLKRLPPEVVRAGSLFSDGELSAAENILRAYLREAVEHAEALRLLGRIQQQRGAIDEAEALLESAVKFAPNYRAAVLDYVRVLIERQKYPQGHEVVSRLLKSEPGNRDCLSLYAAACIGLGRHEAAIAVYRELLAASPADPELRVGLGHSLKSIGQQSEAIASYKAAAELRPSFGDAYWSLANLKTYHFSLDEIASMRVAEGAPTTDPVDRYHLCFALGKAYEDRKDYTESWQFYERGNRLKRAESRYDPKIIATKARGQRETCTAEFFAARAGAGAPDRDRIGHGQRQRLPSRV